MDKIPVGATIAHAYRFAFGKFFALLSIVWLPFAVLIPAGLLMTRQAALLSGAMASRNFSGIGSALLIIVPFYIVAILLLLMQFVGMTEQALGRRKGSPYFYFNIGRPLWLLAATVLLFLLVLVGLITVTFVGSIVVGVVGGALGGISRAVSVVVLALGTVAVYLALIYAWVRLSFLMVPVVVAEDRIGLGRAWALGKGNFWRMFLILLAVLIPVFSIQIAFMFTFLWQGMPPAVPVGASPAQLQAARAAAEAWNTAMAMRMYHYWYLTFPFFLVFGILLYGLLTGAQASAYRALIPDHEASAEAFS